MTGLLRQVVAELGQPDEAGSLTDLGLRPGGRVKLIKSNTILLENPLRSIHTTHCWNFSDGPVCL